MCLKGTLKYQYVLRTVVYNSRSVSVPRARRWHLIYPSKQAQSRGQNDCVSWDNVNLMLQKEFHCFITV